MAGLADERVAIIIQIQLAQNNHEAAEKELNAAKSWAQDSLLAQLAEVLPPFVSFNR
jgi:coatomer subunit epsilon